MMEEGYGGRRQRWEDKQEYEKPLPLSITQNEAERVLGEILEAYGDGWHRVEFWYDKDAGISGVRVFNKDGELQYWLPLQKGEG